MTNKQLQDKLKEYPADWDVWVELGSSDGPVIDVTEDPVEQSIVFVGR